MNAIIFTIIIQIKNISILLSPYYPKFKQKSVLDTLNIEEKNRNLDGILKDIINMK